MESNEKDTHKRNNIEGGSYPHFVKQSERNEHTETTERFKKILSSLENKKQEAQQSVSETTGVSKTIWQKWLKVYSDLGAMNLTKLGFEESKGAHKIAEAFTSRERVKNEDGTETKEDLKLIERSKTFFQGLPPALRNAVLKGASVRTAIGVGLVVGGIATGGAAGAAMLAGSAAMRATGGSILGGTIHELIAGSDRDEQIQKERERLGSNPSHLDLLVLKRRIEYRAQNEGRDLETNEVYKEIVKDLEHTEKKDKDIEKVEAIIQRRKRNKRRSQITGAGLALLPLGYRLGVSEVLPGEPTSEPEQPTSETTAETANQDEPVPETTAETRIVEAGDTLWGILETMYGKDTPEFREAWSKLLAKISDELKEIGITSGDINSIKPGEVITIPSENPTHPTVNTEVIDSTVNTEVIDSTVNTEPTYPGTNAREEFRFMQGAVEDKYGEGTPEFWEAWGKLLAKISDIFKELFGVSEVLPGEPTSEPEQPTSETTAETANQDEPVPETTAETRIVEAGDTLWGILETMYGKDTPEFREAWSKLLAKISDELKEIGITSGDINSIKPGEVITIPSENPTHPTVNTEVIDSTVNTEVIDSTVNTEPTYPGTNAREEFRFMQGAVEDKYGEGTPEFWEAWGKLLAKISDIFKELFGVSEALAETPNLTIEEKIIEEKITGLLNKFEENNSGNAATLAELKKTFDNIHPNAKGIYASATEVDATFLNVSEGIIKNKFWFKTGEESAIFRSPYVEGKRTDIIVLIPNDDRDNNELLGRVLKEKEQEDHKIASIELLTSGQQGGTLEVLYTHEGVEVGGTEVGGVEVGGAEVGGVEAGGVDVDKLISEGKITAKMVNTLQLNSANASRLDENIASFYVFDENNTANVGIQLNWSEKEIKIYVKTADLLDNALKEIPSMKQSDVEPFKEIAYTVGSNPEKVLWETPLTTAELEQSTSDTAAEPETAPAETRIVEAGDTLWGILETEYGKGTPKFREAWGKLLAKTPNELKAMGVTSGEADLIYPGDTINIGEMIEDGEISSSETAEVQSTQYTVREGDNIWNILESTYEPNSDEFWRAYRDLIGKNSNELKEIGITSGDINSIKPGEVITIPSENPINRDEPETTEVDTTVSTIESILGEGLYTGENQEAWEDKNITLKVNEDIVSETKNVYSIVNLEYTGDEVPDGITGVPLDAFKTFVSKIKLDKTPRGLLFLIDEEATIPDGFKLKSIMPENVVAKIAFINLPGVENNRNKLIELIKEGMFGGIEENPGAVFPFSPPGGSNIERIAKSAFIKYSEEDRGELRDVFKDEDIINTYTEKGIYLNKQTDDNVNLKYTGGAIPEEVRKMFQTVKEYEDFTENFSVNNSALNLLADVEIPEGFDFNIVSHSKIKDFEFDRLETLPEGIVFPNSIEELHLENLEELPENITFPEKIKDLILDSLTELPESITFPENLENLYLKSFDKRKFEEWLKINERNISASTKIYFEDEDVTVNTMKTRMNQGTGGR